MLRISYKTTFDSIIICFLFVSLIFILQRSVFYLSHNGAIFSWFCFWGSLDFSQIFHFILLILNSNFFLFLNRLHFFCQLNHDPSSKIINFRSNEVEIIKFKRKLKICSCRSFNTFKLHNLIFLHHQFLTNSPFYDFYIHSTLITISYHIRIQFQV